MSNLFTKIKDNILNIIKKPNFQKVVKNAPNEIGVYIVRLNGAVKYIGRAIEQRDGQSTRGLRKRLMEHFRGSSTGKKELFKYKNEINIAIKKCKSVAEAIAKEAELIKKHNTVKKGWNKRYENLK